MRGSAGSRDKHVAIWRVNSEDDPRESRQALISRQKHEQKVRDVRFSAGTSVRRGCCGSSRAASLLRPAIASTPARLRLSPNPHDTCDVARLAVCCACFSRPWVRAQLCLRTPPSPLAACPQRVGSVSSDGFFVLWDPNDMRVVRSYQLAAKACFTRVESVRSAPRRDPPSPGVLTFRCSTRLPAVHPPQPPPPLVLPAKQNVVCLAMEQHAAAIGSNTHLSVLDTRANVTSFERGVAEDFGKAWGVRSLSFKDHLLTVGGGSGRVYFVDLRTNRFLPLESERGKLEDAAERRRLQQQHQGEAGDLDDEELDDEDFYDSDFDPLDGALLSDEDRKRGKVHLMTGAGYICKENDVYQARDGGAAEEGADAPCVCVLRLRCPRARLSVMLAVLHFLLRRRTTTRMCRCRSCGTPATRTSGTQTG